MRDSCVKHCALRAQIRNKKKMHHRKGQSLESDKKFILDGVVMYHMKMTALHVFCYSYEAWLLERNQELLTWILEELHIDVNALDVNGRPAFNYVFLHDRIINHCEDTWMIVHTLLKHGADYHHLLRKGRLPRVVRTHHDYFSFFMERGACHRPKDTDPPHVKNKCAAYARRRQRCTSATVALIRLLRHVKVVPIYRDTWNMITKCVWNTRRTNAWDKIK